VVTVIPFHINFAVDAALGVSSPSELIWCQQMSRAADIKAGGGNIEQGLIQAETEKVSRKDAKPPRFF
jgi:hypothetical protein